MRLQSLVLFLLFGMICNVNAQRNCSTMEYLDQQIQEDPNRIERMEQIEAYTREWIEKGNQRAVVTIPVVFHVVYNTSSENISDAQVLSQLDVLNEDFRRLNSDANNTWPQAADTEIEFCLASVDPNGNATSGITRTSTSVSSFGSNDNVKFNSSGGKDAWPAGDYLNFWICDLSGGLLGYAQFPGGPANTDGVVCDYLYTGTVGVATAPFNLGRTGTHEVGHWLNLRHIWGDGNCNFDDFVSDTPESDASNGGCPTGHTSCGTTDMIENYMDYTDDACMNLFTAGQKSRMQALFGPGGSRVSLLSSGGCGGGGNPPTCTDGVQNGNETGVDCGGPDCPPCSSNCDDNPVVVSITLDNYPEETSWGITNSSGTTVASGGTYGSQPDGSTVTIDLCLVDGCYDFTIYDSYGDGICCGYGNGSYSVTNNGNTLASGGSFGSSETTNFCLGGGPAPTCTDGVQNGNETGVDCGGPDCDPCPTCTDGVQNGSETGVDCGGPDCPACPTCNDGIQNGNETGVDCGGPDCAPCGGGSNTILAHFFENGWDGWQDGGSDCARYSGTRSWEGSYSIRLRDNSGIASAMTSSSYDVSGYSSLEIEFYFYPNSMENGEDFWVRYYDGSSWSTVASYASGSSFSNDQFYVATVTINSSSYNFPSNAQFRFQCDASGNGDRIYIDAVTITGNGSGSKLAGQTIRSLGGVNTAGALLSETDFTINPNPVDDLLNIDSEETIKNVKIYNISGMLVKDIDVNDLSVSVNVSDIRSGLYIISLETEEEVLNQKFVKQ